MPLVSRTFDQLIDFTRTTSGTFVGSNGFIQSTPQSRNLLTYTQEFDNAVWGKTELTVSANTSTAPDGTTTADIVIPTTNAAAHFVTLSVSMTAGVTYALSVYAKASGYRWLRLSFAAAAFPANNRAASFDLQTGTVGQVQSGVTATISDAGNGWYRCAIVATATTTTTAANGYTVNDADNANAATFSGNGTSGIFIWGAQLETGSTATTYTRNYGGLYPPRFDYDPVTLAPKGLLIEEQRSNLVTYSEQFDNAAWGATGGTISANSTTSPDGTVDADSFVEAVGSTDPRLPRAVTLVIGTTYALSVYAKIIPGSAQRYLMLVFNAGFPAQAGVNFDLVTGTVGATNGGASGTITAVGNGWYRCSIVTPAATATSASFRYRIASVNTSANIAGPAAYTGDGTSGYYFYGAQLEAGAFATSYIPTVASTVTRTADVATIQAPNFAPWYNQSEGTFVVSFLDQNTAASGSSGLFAVGNPALAFTSAETIYVTRSRASGSPSFGTVIDNGVVQANPGNIVIPTGSSTVAIGYKLNDTNMAANGAVGVTDTSCTMPTPVSMSIGSLVSAWDFGAAHINGHIRSIRYYPTRLTNAQLQALTA